MPIAIQDININIGEKPVSVFMGRCQPLSKAHYNIIEEMISDGNEPYVFLVHGAKSKQELNPFDIDIQEKMINEAFDNVKIRHISNGFMGEFINILRNENLEPINWYCGSDNEVSYRGQLDRYKDSLNLSLSLKVVNRTDEISSTKIRESLKNDDKSSFKELVCEKLSTDFWFVELKRYVT